MSSIQGWIIVFLLLVLICLSLYRLFFQKGMMATTTFTPQTADIPNNPPQQWDTPRPPPAPPPPPHTSSPSLTETILKSGALGSMMDMYRYKSELGDLQKIERDMADITPPKIQQPTPITGDVD